MTDMAKKVLKKVVAKVEILSHNFSEVPTQDKLRKEEFNPLHKLCMSHLKIFSVGKRLKLALKGKEFAYLAMDWEEKKDLL
jgi:hypothetical protein